MPTSTTSTPVSQTDADSSNSKNWKALAIPSLDGKKTELNVSGEVRSGFAPPELTLRSTKEKRPPNVIALDLKGLAGGPFVNVSYKQDITGYKYDIVLVYINNTSEIEAAIKIEQANS